MDILVDLRQIASGVEQIGAHVAREIRDVFDAPHAIDIMDLCQQVAQPRNPAVAVLEAVAVDGLADKRDFLAALIGKLANLGENMFRRPALFRSTDAGHDAIGAKLVAAELRADKSLKRRRSRARL